ncbi:MAG TPA: peptidoglycan recognition family protein [Acidimicrobiales bacterium]|nr:peptidoglycan recognition family protein [Acidimicrobiales bacterium]
MTLPDRLVTRKEWGAAGARARTAIKSTLGNTIHYEGPQMGSFAHSTCAAKVRGIQQFHMNKRGWADIAYTSVVCPHGSVFEGRWLGVRTAAQGTNEGNRTHYAHCYLSGKGDPLTDEARAAMHDVLAYFRANGSGDQLRPHQFWHSTECPGDPLLGFIQDKPQFLQQVTPQLEPGGIPGAVSFMPRPGGGGWVVASDGGVFATGTQFFGSRAGKGGPTVAGGASTPSGMGYWLVDVEGHVFTFGDAEFQGPFGQLTLNRPITAMAATPDGRGYWLFGADGGVFNFGSAPFHDSVSSLSLQADIRAGCAVQAAGRLGYLMAAGDGGAFAFPDKGAHGSMGDVVLHAPVVGVAATPTGEGYWLFAEDGGVFAFGDAPFRGVYAALSREWEQGRRRIIGGECTGDPADRSTWGYVLYSDRLPVERYRFEPGRKR